MPQSTKKLEKNKEYVTDENRQISTTTKRKISLVKITNKQ